MDIELSCSPVLPSLILTSSLPAVQHPVADPRFVRPEPLAIWSRSATRSTCIGAFSHALGSRWPAPGGTPDQAPGGVVHRQRVSKIVQTGTICPFGTTFGAETSAASDTWLCNLARLGAFGGRDLEPAAICNAGNCLLSSRHCRGLGLR